MTYFIKRLPKPVPESWDNPHVDYWDGQESTALFLCTNDIKLGDTYYHDVYHPYPNGEVADTNSKVMDAHMTIANEGPNYEGDYSFKVLGEISPRALTFVKEGDIIEEGGFKLCYWPGGSGSETWNVIPWDLMGSLAKGDRHKLYTMAKIQCRQCKHFH